MHKPPQQLLPVARENKQKLEFRSTTTNILDAVQSRHQVSDSALHFAIFPGGWVGVCIIWGFLVKVETDCKALQDIVMSDTLNTTHARWCDGVLAHHIVDVRHIPGRVNLVGDGISRMDEGQPHLVN